MQKTRLTQQLTQKLSAQQIQFIQLLQLPGEALAERIAAEVASNPVLEQVGNDKAIDLAESASTSLAWRGGEKIQLAAGYIPIAKEQPSMVQQLQAQLRFIPLTYQEQLIATHLIGMLERDGYLRRTLQAIVADLTLLHNISPSLTQVESLLKKIQQLDPPGIAARNLQECLLLQLQRLMPQPNALSTAINIVTHCFKPFLRKHYQAIMAKLGLNKQTLQQGLELIASLKPHPWIVQTNPAPVVLKPDFIVLQREGRLEVSLNNFGLPALRLNEHYAKLWANYQKKTKQVENNTTKSFLQQNIERARWFMQALKQRENTLIRTMKAIVKLQSAFFWEENEKNLKPLVLRQVAEAINMDMSTVSRIVSKKAVQTTWQIYPLKFFFSGGIATATGQDVSTRAVKQALRKLIEAEDKQHPYTDEQLKTLLHAKGYPIARRTIAKYRIQQKLPVARLRKQLL